MKSSFDYSEFESYVKNFEKMTKDFDNFLKKFLLQMAQRVVSRCVKRTPVDTGAMKASWGIGSQKLALTSNIDVFGDLKVALDTKNSQVADINVIGSNLEVVIWNGMDYSSFVEYGHANRDGSWREGFFILTVAIDEVQRQIPARFQRAFEIWVKEKGV